MAYLDIVCAPLRDGTKQSILSPPLRRPAMEQEGPLEIHLSPQEGDVVSIEVRHDLRTRASLLTLTSYEACRLLLQDYEFNELLDIGSG